MTALNYDGKYFARQIPATKNDTGGVRKTSKSKIQKNFKLQPLTCENLTHQTGLPFIGTAAPLAAVGVKFEA
jgi:hypothetical protein